MVYAIVSKTIRCNVCEGSTPSPGTLLNLMPTYNIECYCREILTQFTTEQPLENKWDFVNWLVINSNQIIDQLADHHLTTKLNSVRRIGHGDGLIIENEVGKENQPVCGISFHGTRKNFVMNAD